jgi:Uma2 family endonuclease
LSASNEKRDLVDKLRVLHAHGVPHYWIMNPEDKTLVVHRWEPDGYLIILTAVAGEIIRAEPFESVVLRVATFFGDEDDD